MTDALDARLLAPFSTLERYFARSMARLSGDDSPSLLLGAAAALHALSRGDLCYTLGDELRSESDDAVDAGVEDVAWPEAEAWTLALRHSPAVEFVGAAIDEEGAGAPERAARPLVLDAAGRLYLRRTFAEQHQVAEALTARALAEVEVDEDALATSLAGLFAHADEHDLQREAAAMAVRRHLSLITGGPGTGKTTTVAKVLASLVEQAFASGAPAPRVALTAPTGKAAARMAESLAATARSLDVSAAVLAALPARASTMHRLLGLAPGMRQRLPAGRLPYDVVVVDEASMVDLSLMAELTRALSAGARLVLLGDADQLASVAMGAVFADLCAAPEGSPLGRSRVRLLVGHRYAAGSAVGRLAEYVRLGDSAGALALLRDPQQAQVALHDAIDRRARADVIPSRADAVGAHAQGESFFELVCAGYAPHLAAEGPEARLRAFDAFRVLTAHRRGPFGAPALAARVRDVLIARGLLPTSADGTPTIDPVLVIRNAPALGLFNGDVGYVDRRAGVEPLAYFRLEGGAIRSFSPSRLPAHESAWATTVHKSQGSELDRVALVLPERLSPVCTRELVYTAVTRARLGVHIYAPEAIVAAAIARPTERRGGLRDALKRLA